MAQPANVSTDFTAATAAVASQPPGKSPSDLMAWLSQETARVLGTWSDGAGTGALADPSPSVRAVIDALPAPAAGEIAVVELAQPLGDAAGSPFLLAASPVDGGPVQIFAMALTVLGLHHNVFGIPVVGAKIERVLARIGADRTDPSNQRLMEYIQTYPRLRLIVADEDELARVFGGLRDLGDDDLALFLRTDKLARFARALVYLPRDRYTSRARGVLIDVLEAETGMKVDRFTARVTESAIARIQFVLLPRDEATVPVFHAEDETRIRARLGEVSRTWDEDVLAAASAAGADSDLVAAYLPGISPNYKEDQTPAYAVADIARIAKLPADGIDLVFYDPTTDRGANLGFTMYLTGGQVTLSQVLPVLQSLGVEVLDERPYTVRRPDGVLCSVYEFGLRVSPVLRATAAEGVAEADLPQHLAHLRSLAGAGAAAVWRGDAEVDRFNELIFAFGLDWRRVALLRAIAAYLRQCGFAYSPGHMAQVLLEHREAVLALQRLWTAEFDPVNADAEAAVEATADVEAALAAVTSLDADRILRAYLHVVQATVRTNFYAADKQVLSLKLEPGRIPETPKPRPRFEIFVYSPRVEGVHLRFGMVARGGLRWSDRREDFRTEILGLVKAQAVKNAVIVPVGAKGGFVLKQPPAPTGDAAADRDAQRAEGVACYSAFIAGLLDVTDNLGPDGEVLPPERVVRRDPDDTYLVVAADKGTASFSDIANGVAAGYGFWLGDAFASGGSEGYDHKGMGITAKGAWESVKMHFRERGIDTQTQDFTAAGVGDMSGDVFGNGMLLSEHIRLVAAFDHRDVFLDPNPDAAIGFAERTRLFELPRSSWQDYDASKISSGGGVFSRNAKSVPISPEVRALLDLADDVTELTPPELIRAVLLAPVDLLWNGGIGTYVKASSETNLDVGDRANDAIRVNGNEVRARVIGEGGNLGVTPLGRIEFDRNGGQINTDALDNSAGVDCSDHEVNIKILVDRQITAGAIEPAERHELLVSMTDDVSSLVLADNISQNTALSVERSLAPRMVDVHARILADLAAHRGVDLRLEALPGRKETDRLQAAGLGLSSPELANLMAHVKLAVKDDVLASDLPDNDVLTARLPEYFPTRLRPRAEAIAAHPLRREIVATQLVNEMIDNAGVSYVYRLREETGAGTADAVRAFVAVSRVFGLSSAWAEIRKLPVSAQETAALLAESRRVLDRGARWMLTNRPQPLAVGAEINRYATRIAALSAAMPEWNVAYDEHATATAAKAIAAGVPDEIAFSVSRALYRYSLLDVVDIADVTEREDDEVGRLYFGLMQHLRVDRMLVAVAGLPRGDRWSEMARLALRDDLYAALRALTIEVLNFTDPEESTERKIADWVGHNARRLDQVGSLLAEILDSEDGAHGPANDESRLSVATRALRSLLRTVG